VAVSGYECSGSCRELADKYRRYSRPAVCIVRLSSEASCNTAAAAVGVSRAVSHRYKFVSHSRSAAIPELFVTISDTGIPYYGSANDV